MEFRILGPLRVIDGDTAVTVGGVRERTALAVLLSSANRVVPVADLVDALWPYGPPATARQQIQTTVSVLRRALDAGRLVTEPPGYRLRIEPGELDAHEFERRVALARGGPGAVADALREALALWRGAAFDGLDAPALRIAAAGLEEQRMAAVEDRAEAELDAGRWGAVVAELTTLAGAHPFRERLRAALMIALYRTGRPADALRSYRDYRRLLVSELGLEPGHRLQSVERAILCADPVLAAP